MASPNRFDVLLSGIVGIMSVKHSRIVHRLPCISLLPEEENGTPGHWKVDVHIFGHHASTHVTWSTPRQEKRSRRPCRMPYPGRIDLKAIKKERSRRSLRVESCLLKRLNLAACSLQVHASKDWRQAPPPHPLQMAQIPFPRLMT